MQINLITLIISILFIQNSLQLFCNLLPARQVCGQDGQTYRNKCQAKFRKVQIRHNGACSGSCQQCPILELPVCGNDGQTYRNSCEADCNGIIVNHAGACRKDCECTNDHDFVCGSNGVTYKNYCHLECEREFEGYYIQLAYQGQCGQACNCPTVLNPVCGTDGNKYNSVCHANCSNIPVDNNSDCLFLFANRLPY